MESALLNGTSDLARLVSGKAAPGAPGQIHGNWSDDLVHPIGWGRDTAEAIRAGALRATASLIWTAIAELVAARTLGVGSVVLVLTGGAAPALQGACRSLAKMPAIGLSAGITDWRVEVHPWLVLEGLALEPPCFLPLG